MISMRADTDHGPLPRMRGHQGPGVAPPASAGQGTGDWICAAIGADRDVLLLGSAAVRYAANLARQRCSLVAIGCGTAEAVDLGFPAAAGDLAAIDLGRELGDRRFDAILAAELLDCAGDPYALLVELREWLRPGGFIVASQSEQPGAADRATKRRRGGHATLLGLFERAGFAVARSQALSLPAIELPVSADATAVDPLAGVGRVDRTLVVASPIGDLDRIRLHPDDRSLAEERDAAERHAANLSQELRSAAAQIGLLVGRLEHGERRERELGHLLRLAHERSERDNEALRTLARRFHEDFRREEEQRKSLELRLNRIRGSLPGRLFLAARAVAAIGRR